MFGADHEPRTVRHVPGRHWFGAHRNLMVAYWARICTPGELRELRSIYRAIAAEERRAVSVLHFVEQGAGLPASLSRDELVDDGQVPLGSLACVGVVLAGAGFWVSALSSFIVGVRMVLPQDTLPFRVARDLESMAPWFVGEHRRVTGERVEPATLRTWVDTARASMAGA